MVLLRNRGRDFAKNLESHGEKHVWSEINRHEVDKRSNADVGLECNNGSSGEDN